LANAVDTPPPDPISARTLAFCRLLRAEGLPITPARVMDALRALTFIDSSQVDDFRLALRLNLASSQTQEATFDRVFTHYFYDTADERRLPSGIRGETMRGQLGHHYKDLDQAVDAPPEAWAPEASGHAVDLRARWDPDAPPLEQIIRELARRLATRPSRRFQTGRRGEKVDLRRSVRRNARHGFDLLDLARARRKQRRTRLVMLCDVSGSMDAFNPFLLQLMFIGSGIVLIIQDIILPNKGWTMQPLKISFISIFGVLYYVSSTICILLSCFYHYLNARRDYPYSWPELNRTTFTEFICVFIWFFSIFFHGHFISLIFLGGLIPF
jgi:uncharacterized protein with von Willebrand factor type A (vWA) domain